MPSVTELMKLAKEGGPIEIAADQPPPAPARRKLADKPAKASKAKAERKRVNAPKVPPEPDALTEAPEAPPEVTPAKEGGNAYQNREAWLTALSERLKPLFLPFGTPVPEKVRIATAFPGTGRKGKRIGECWSSDASADATFEIMIRPDLADPVEVAAVVAHELVHASVGLQAKHGKEFRRVAEGIGLTGKMTATVAGPELLDTLRQIAEDLGPFPHGALNLEHSITIRKKQTTRMVKLECDECGYVARTTRKWLDQVGVLHCPAHGPMSADGGR